MLLHGKMTFDGLAKRAMDDAMKAARKLKNPEGDVEPTSYLYYTQEEVEPELDEILGPYDLPRRLIEPRQHPERIEALWVHVFDAEITKSWNAQVTRRPQRPPRLGHWVARGSVEGRIIDPILKAMR